MSYYQDPYSTESLFRASPSSQLQTEGWEGMGPTPVPNPFTQQGQPTWMQGAWSAPWWGMSAVNPQQALTQQDLMYQQPPQPPQPPPEDPRSRFIESIMRSRDLMRRMRSERYGYENSTYHGFMDP